MCAWLDGQFDIVHQTHYARTPNYTYKRDRVAARLLWAMRRVKWPPRTIKSRVVHHYLDYSRKHDYILFMGATIADGSVPRR